MTHEPNDPTASTARNDTPDDRLRRLLGELYPDRRERLKAEPLGYHHAALRIHVPTPAPEEAPEHLRGLLEPLAHPLAVPLRTEGNRPARRRRAAGR